MAKRMTDSEKWRKPWFRKLPPKMKLLWCYLLDTCDFAGIWAADVELASFSIGEDLTIDELQHHFGSKMVCLSEDKIFFPGFIEFQYDELNPACRPHRAVIKILDHYGIDSVTLTLREGCAKGIFTHKDKEKDKDQAQEKDKDQEQAKDKDKERDAAQNETAAPKLRVVTPAPHAEAPSRSVEKPGRQRPRVPDAPEIARCKAAWKATLEHFGQDRNLTSAEETRIARAITHWNAESVELALIGARYEPGDKNFNPAKNVFLQRVLPYDEKPDDRDRKFERFLGLGSQARREGRGKVEMTDFERELQAFDASLDGTPDPAESRELSGTRTKGDFDV